jgi:hypothetical protein
VQFSWNGSFFASNRARLEKNLQPGVTPGHLDTAVPRKQLHRRPVSAASGAPSVLPVARFVPDYYDAPPAAISQQRQDVTIAASAILGGIGNDGSSQPHLCIRRWLGNAGSHAVGQSPRRHDVPAPEEPSGSARCIAGDGWGLGVSPYRLLKNQLAQSEIRHRPSQPDIGNWLRGN